MPCLFALVAGAFPRFGTLLIWIARPIYFNQAFHGSWFWPILGIVLLPFTTLMYVLLYSPVTNGLYGWDWFWIAMAVVIDLMHYSSTAYYNRNRLPGASATPAQPA